MSGRSWHEGCPVPLDDLVSIRLDYVGFDDAVHDGVLVVHRKLAKETVEIFGELFAAEFKIERMQPYEDFPVGEYAASNDTVGFYCRPAQDDPKDFSSHAYGISVDINPLTNPYRDPKGWWPAGSNGERNRSAPGLLTAELGSGQDFHAARLDLGRFARPAGLHAFWQGHSRRRSQSFAATCLGDPTATCAQLRNARRRGTP